MEARYFQKVFETRSPHKSELILYFSEDDSIHFSFQLDNGKLHHGIVRLSDIGPEIEAESNLDPKEAVFLFATLREVLYG